MAATQALTFGTSTANAATSTAAVGDVTGQALTVELWLKASAQTGNRTVVNKGNGSTQGYTLWLTSEGHLRLYVYDGTGSFETAAAAAGALDGAWHHWAVVKSASVTQWYRDGVANGSSATNAGKTLVTTAGAFAVGRHPSFSDGIVGSASEVRVWNVSRTHAQVVVKHDVQLTGTETGLVGYWPCTEGAGTDVGSLPAGKTLTLTGAGWSAVDAPPVGATALAYAARVLQDSPLCYWRLGETAGTVATDASGAGRHGTYSATGVTLNQSGAVAGGDPAAAFNGATGQVTLATAPTAAVASVTIECWAYLAALPTKGCFLKVGGDTNGYGIGVGGASFDASGSNLLVLFDAVRWVSSGVTLHTGWNHVALVLNASGQPRIFRDGAPVFTDSGTAPIAVTGGLRAGGYEPTGFPRWFAGRLDEVAVYGSALADVRLGVHYESAAESGAAAPAQARRWTGSAWTTTAVQRWTGSAWVPATVKRWDGTGWV